MFLRRFWWVFRLILFSLFSFLFDGKEEVHQSYPFCAFCPSRAGIFRKTGCSRVTSSLLICTVLLWCLLPCESPITTTHTKHELWPSLQAWQRAGRHLLVVLTHFLRKQGYGLALWTCRPKVHPAYCRQLMLHSQQEAVKAAPSSHPIFSRDLSSFLKGDTLVFRDFHA